MKETNRDSFLLDWATDNKVEFERRESELAYNTNVYWYGRAVIRLPNGSSTIVRVERQTSVREALIALHLKAEETMREADSEVEELPKPKRGK